MKTSVISPAFRDTYLSNPSDPNAFEGRAVVFDGPEDYHHRIDDPAEKIDENCILVMRGAGPKGYPGGAEVVNMRAPAYLLKAGVDELPCIGDGRQSGTSGSPSILNAAPEAPDDEYNSRRDALIAAGGFAVPDSQTPWQQYFRELVEPFDKGMTLRGADTYKDVARKGLPRDNH